jgi:hypothetical protein
MKLDRIKNFLGLKTSQEIGSFFYTIICILGCGFQVISVTRTFFLFEVLTRITIDFPQEVSTPALTLCFRFTEILNLTLFNEKYHTNYTKPFSVSSRLDIQNKITMGDIFDLTPSQEENLFLSCIIRSPLDYSHAVYDSDACRNDIFRMIKYQIMEYMCYSFKMIDSNLTMTSTKHLKNRLALSLDFASTLFSIQLNTSVPGVNNMDLTRPVIHSQDTFPYLSLVLTQIFWRKINDIKGFSSSEAGKAQDVNIFMLSYSMTKIERMPAPYTSQCRRYVQNSCIDHCVMKNSVEKFKKLPFEVITLESNIKENPTLRNLLLLSSEDVKGNKSGAEIMDMVDRCLDGCRQPPCSLDYTLTKTSTATSNNQSMIDILVGSPTEPFVMLHQSPKLPLNDFILLALSLVGFWLGVSAFCLNPVKKLTSFRNRNSKVIPDVRKILKPKHQHSSYCEKTRKMIREHIDKEIENFVNDVFIPETTTLCS